MSRIKRGVITKKRHKKLLKKTKGYWGQRSNVYRRAKETLMRAYAFAFKGRKQKKRTFRRLFINRISASCKTRQISYNVFINAMKHADVQLNRKMLSQIAIFEPKAFDKLVKLAKSRTS